MGLLDYYIGFGSDYSPLSDPSGPGTPGPSALASSKNSKLHATQDGQPGYSLDGSYENVVNAVNNSYINGGAISLPNPSQLDINQNISQDLFLQAAAGKNSPLHATQDGQPGYSLNGNFVEEINAINNAYTNGGAISIPSPSELDINGATPITALKDPNTKVINNTFLNGEYINSIPTTLHDRININNTSYV